MAFLEIENLSYTYPLGESPALDGIDLRIGQGEFTVIMGSDGAGRSTLCRVIADLIPRVFGGELTGRVRIGSGQDRARPGFVFDNPFNQFSGAKFTVAEELAFGMENLGIDRRTMEARIDEVMALVDITDIKDRNPSTLSGGQAQRVALASILVMEPELLVLDEPASQLDPAGSREILQLIKKVNRRGVTIVMAVQTMAHLTDLADTVVVLSRGKIVATGSPQAVLTSPEMSEHGVEVPRVTTIARKARSMGFFHGDTLPISLENVEKGFQNALLG
ncbi:MAG: ATP-binding cassette domain-containing protein [Desulfobacteraceae bacterium]|nr:ATP-binding cassette domain-containing protein [Desulfobacteraceae bacterium]